MVNNQFQSYLGNGTALRNTTTNDIDLEEKETIDLFTKFINFLQLQTNHKTQTSKINDYKKPKVYSSLNDLTEAINYIT